MDSFKHRCVRDLAWVIASPPLVSGVFENKGYETKWWSHADCLKELEDCKPMLQRLDEDPQALLNHLKQLKSKRLGLRFEAFISFWLAFISPNFKLLLQNIQLYEIASDASILTIGEVDFIIQELLSGKTIHLEVAVKFYLGTAPLEDNYRWFGTNTHDQLGKKADHLKQHQTQLLLNNKGKVPYVIDERQCLLKGRLFYPLSSTLSLDTQAIKPQGIANNHLYGRYMFYDQASMLKDKFIVLDKIDWLSVLTNEDIVEKNLINKIEPVERAYCYARLEQNKIGASKEVERLFCLPASFVFPSSG